MIIYAKLQSSRVRHQYGIFGGKSQTSFKRNATRSGSEEGRLFSQASSSFAPNKEFRTGNSLREGHSLALKTLKGFDLYKFF